MLKIFRNILNGFKIINKSVKIGNFNPIFSKVMVSLFMVITFYMFYLLYHIFDFKVSIALLDKSHEIDVIRNVFINIVNLIIPVVNNIFSLCFKFLGIIFYFFILFIVGWINTCKLKHIEKKFVDMDLKEIIVKDFEKNTEATKISIWSKVSKEDIEKYFSNKIEHFFGRKLYKIINRQNMNLDIVLVTKEKYSSLTHNEVINFKDENLSFEKRLQGVCNFLNLHISHIHKEENYLFKNIYFNSNEKYSFLKTYEVEIIHRLKKVINIESSDINIYDYKITLRKDNMMSYIDCYNSVLPTINKMSIPYLLGADTSGNIQVVDFENLYHSIIGGTTGSGKTNFVHNLLSGLLLANKNITYVIADIKKDMNMYKQLDNIVYTDNVEDCYLVLKKLVEEMERRNTIFSEMSFVKDLKKYNKISNNPLPYVVIIIDEIGELYLRAQKMREQIEDLVQRLVQASRSVGFRLILSTQKPVVDVINGLIKGNCSNRFGFMVQNSLESRIILDNNKASTIQEIGEYYFKSNNKDYFYKAIFLDDNEHEKILKEVEKFKILV